MKPNQFYKGTPYRAGEAHNVSPTLHIQMVEVVEDRKHIKVVTKGGVKMLLAYDGKAGCFHLHKYRLDGAIGGKVYNNWVLTPLEDVDRMNDASARW